MSTAQSSLVPELCRSFDENTLYLIMKEIYGTCSNLRRHIVNVLNQQGFARQEVVSCKDEYRDQYRDRKIRSQAILRMNFAKRLTYINIRTKAEALRTECIDAGNTDVPHGMRVVEKNWLQNPPMDLATFGDFCLYPRKSVYKSRSIIFLELFPRADFIDPPAELSDETQVPHPISQEQRDELKHRQRQNGINMTGHVCDRDIYEGLLTMWKTYISTLTLPDRVKGVKIIFSGLAGMTGNKYAKEKNARLRRACEALNNQEGINRKKIQSFLKRINDYLP